MPEDVATPAAYRTARELLVADRSVGDGEFRVALCELTDRWLHGVYGRALARTGSTGDGIALVALGGYGRGELCPGSDLDLAVVHRRHPTRAAAVAEAVWYPVWDTGIHLGNSVWSIAEAVEVVGVDIETSTALLDARLVAGDAAVVDELVDDVHRAWTAALTAVVHALRSDAADRRARFGDVAFSVEPNLKTAGGGLRDAQIPAWLEVAGTLIGDDDRADLDAARWWLSDVRVALHRAGGATGDVLRLEDQDAVAAELGLADADELMTQVARAARSVDWVLDEVWVQASAVVDARPRTGWRRRLRGDGHSDTRSSPSASPARTGPPPLGGTGPDTPAGPGGTEFRPVHNPPVVTADPASSGDLTGPDADDLDTTDPAEVLGFVAATARDGRRLGRPLLARLAAETRTPAEPWDVPTRTAFVELCLAGPGMIPVVEALDHVGVWERFLPEWGAVRTRAQRTTHHRFTVDRHLLETVAIASGLTERVTRPDLLVVAALLHDLGKGHRGDHTEVGVTLAEQVARRMGYGPDAVDTLTTLVRLHLLLPEVATRRDIGDVATIESVADAVGSVPVLGLLLALTEADARATGPTAWTDWKAGLVRTLVERTGAALTGTIDAPLGPAFPSIEQLALLQSGVQAVRGADRTLTVVAPDRPRLFCRVTGALVLAGLDVVSAAVTSSDGTALEEFTVTPAFASADLAAQVAIDWPKVVADVERAMAGRVAIAARVAERADTYRRRQRSADAGVHIRFDDATGDECVVEVDAPDGVGVLYGITRALADLDVDIRYARVETRTDRVVDAFSITDSSGVPIRDEAYRAEIARAIRHAVAP